MKKIYCFLFVLIASLLANRAMAQAMMFTVTPTNQCYSASGNNGVAAMTSFGASTSFSWTLIGPPGGCTPTFTVAGSSGTLINISYPCCGTYTVLCAGYIGTTAVQTATRYPYVSCSPTVVAAASSTGICAGSTGTLTASGASSYTWVPGVISGPSIVVSPTVNTCYTVVGTDASGCMSSAAAVCVNMLPVSWPTISGTSSVCLGSSFSLSASGSGSSFIWNTGATTATLVQNPATPGIHNYSVGMPNANGCIGTASHAVFVDSLCAIVWPGDANSDGVVDNTDVFEIGLSYSGTGAVRTPTSNAWTGQYATTWAGNGSTGKNKCHIDCNGDGTINNDDTVAIYNNYSQTHAFRNANTSSNSDLSFSSTQANVIAGVWNTFNILLGSNSNNISMLYGVAFDVNFDLSLVQSAYITYTTSFLNTPGSNVQFRKTDLTTGKIHAASVRTNGINVTGNGMIAQLHLLLKPSAAGQMALSFSNAQKINALGTITVLGSNPYNTLVYNLIDGISTISNTQTAFELFPNPAGHQVTLQGAPAKESSYSLCDLSGREVSKGTFTGSTTINLDTFENGVYLVKISNGVGSAFKKLVVEK